MFWKTDLKLPTWKILIHDCLEVLGVSVKADYWTLTFLGPCFWFQSPRVGPENLYPHISCIFIFSHSLGCCYWKWSWGHVLRLFFPALYQRVTYWWLWVILYCRNIQPNTRDQGLKIDLFWLAILGAEKFKVGSSWCFNNLFKVSHPNTTTMATKFHPEFWRGQTIFRP